MKVNIPPAVVKVVLLGVVALVYAFMASMVVYCLIRVFIGTATTEMAQDLALVAGILVFVGIYVFSREWGGSTEH